MYYRYEGPVTFDQAYNGTAPKHGAACSGLHRDSKRASECDPSRTTLSPRALPIIIYDWWSVDVDYKYSRFTTNSTGSYQSLLERHHMRRPERPIQFGGTG